MRLLIWFIIVNVAFKASAKSGKGTKPSDDPLQAYNEVVRSLIRNWEAPVAYLRDRGFLPSNFEDTSKIKPNLDALMQRIERDKRDQSKPKDAIVNIKPKEVQEIKKATNTRIQRGFLSPNLEQAEAKITKVSKSKSKLNEQEQQLLAMKRRLEQLQQESTRQDQPEYHSQVQLTPKAKEPVKSAQSYDEILQRMIEKTSPHFKHHSNMRLAALETRTASEPSVNQKSADTPQASKKENTADLGSINFRMYSAQSNLFDKTISDMPKSSRAEKQKNKEASNLDLELVAPRYLNWDMKKGQLDHYSRNEKEAYLNQLVRMFGRNLDLKETNKKWKMSSFPRSTAPLPEGTHSLS
ncbi:LOW QUALITY PROTEIN: uncharacterized protein LOC108106396 [Drosophila eugracilis]|uniref:LOW QUALITY PROTEIN: uncharacterized protein LOC108106396 n=1 Tax=Drosophila eugracilis TaxID=29029 RepID=UPI001BD9DC4C|nr:LOW QUALITY PROTEIN: uncharacterized protein LOC108106396 [Drosophila eugracilis]